MHTHVHEHTRTHFFVLFCIASCHHEQKQTLVLKRKFPVKSTHFCFMPPGFFLQTKLPFPPKEGPQKCPLEESISRKTLTSLCLSASCSQANNSRRPRAPPTPACINHPARRPPPCTPAGSAHLGLGGKPSLSGNHENPSELLPLRELRLPEIPSVPPTPNPRIYWSVTDPLPPPHEPALLPAGTPCSALACGPFFHGSTIRLPEASGSQTRVVPSPACTRQRARKWC